jgi:leader peptidase (prepilin peptidase)/N-methyltransferase
MTYGSCVLSVAIEPAQTLPKNPLNDSLFGEYARMLLTGTAAGAAITSAFRSGSDLLAAMLVVGNLLVLGSLFSRWPPAGLMRCTALVGFATALAALTIRSSAPNGWWSPLPFFSPASLLASLALIAGSDLVVTVQAGISTEKKTGVRSHRVGGLSIGVILLLSYMIVVPSVDAFLEQFRERPSSYVVEDLTIWESARIRSTKFAVFAIFTYFGACWGSFLNVVAYSLPRGEVIALRSSACPKCKTPLRRIDNLPIFSYLNLGGRCRDCGVQIPIRYLIVELIAAGIFASLFLYELVTGAANVPGFQHYQYAGILWIILYTKWPVVGVYFFHCALFCCLLTLSLMEIDRRRSPRRFGWLLLVLFASLPVVFATLRPIPVWSGLPIQLQDNLSPWVAQAIASLIGGGVGWVLGIGTRRAKWLRRARNLPLALPLIGVALGWQAVLTIGIAFFVACSLLTTAAQPRRWVKRFGATAVLLLVAIVHHPFWKMITEIWR